MRATCTSFGFDAKTVDAVVLVASELLANALLHASGPYSVVLEVERELVRVGVRDRSLAMPVLKAFDELAATGRGLQIVAASTVEWGCDPHVDGKTVWASLALPDLVESSWDLAEPTRRGGGGNDPFPSPAGTSRTSSTAPSEAHAERTASRTGREKASPPPQLKRVWYLGVPVAAFLAMRARIEAMLRESTLIALGRSKDEIPEQLRALVERATTQFRPVARAEAAAPPEPVRTDEAGRGDFAVDFPPAVARHLRPFGLVVADLNDWCESSHLLVSPLTNEMLELHSWSIEEALRQLHIGAAPTPFAS